MTPGGTFEQETRHPVELMWWSLCARFRTFCCVCGGGSIWKTEYIRLLSPSIA